MVKDEFDKIYTEAGASGMNATTNWDSTIYFVTVPANTAPSWWGCPTADPSVPALCLSNLPPPSPV